ncbi:TetR family transcriptional regulator [Streptomyces sp. NPDC001380]|uniref:TetR/AcrR family transcriptional regulator n=1 Tax=Streptomyces sp. NPDC001380 TaxID=3364566 RepID=UPI0036797377
MTAEPLHRVYRRELREAALDAARDAVVERGWGAVRISGVATRVGVSRPTLYREFGSREGLGRALVQREAEGFLAAVAEALAAHPGRVGDAVEAALRAVFRQADANPLLAAVLTASHTGADTGLLPHLTTEPDAVLEPARRLVAAWLAGQRPALPAAEADEAADVLVRLTLSHLLQPSPGGDAPAALARLAERLTGGAADGPTG